MWYLFLPVSYTHLDVYKRQVLLRMNVTSVLTHENIVGLGDFN